MLSNPRAFLWPLSRFGWAMSKLLMFIFPGKQYLLASLALLALYRLPVRDHDYYEVKQLVER